MCGIISFFYKWQMITAWMYKSMLKSSYLCSRLVTSFPLSLFYSRNFNNSWVFKEIVRDCQLLCCIIQKGCSRTFGGLSRIVHFLKRMTAPSSFVTLERGGGRLLFQFVWSNLKVKIVTKICNFLIEVVLNKDESFYVNHHFLAF